MMSGPCNICAGCECADKSDPTTCPTYTPIFTVSFDEILGGFKTRIPELREPERDPKDVQIENLRETIRIMRRNNELLSHRVNTLNKENVELRDSRSYTMKRLSKQSEYGNELLVELEGAQRKLLVLKEFLKPFLIAFGGMSLCVGNWRIMKNCPDNKLERDKQLTRGDELVGEIERYLQKCL